MKIAKSLLEKLILEEVIALRETHEGVDHAQDPAGQENQADLDSLEDPSKPAEQQRLDAAWRIWQNDGNITNAVESLFGILLAMHGMESESSHASMMSRSDEEGDI